MDMVKMFLLGLLVALVAVAVWRPMDGQAQAQGMGTTTGSLQIFAVASGTFPYLYIVDTNSRHFAVYTHQGGQVHDTRLWYSRNFADDLSFTDDSSPLKDSRKGFTVKDVRDAAGGKGR